MVRPTTTMLRRSWLDVRARVRRGLSDIAVTEPGPGPCWRDWVLVAMLAVATVAEWIFAPYAYQAISAVPIACAFAMLPYRRQMPLLALVVGFSAQLATDAVVAWQDRLAATAYAHVVAALVLVYALFRWSTPRKLLGGAAFVVAVIYVAEQIVAGGSGRNASEVALFLVPWLVLALFALAMRYRARLAANDAERIRLAERNALARELHDNVAHHVSAIAVQAQAAQFVAASNPAAAVKAMSDVEAIAHQTIDDMRRMVGLLRSDDGNGHTPAAGSLAGLSDPDGKPTVILTDRVDLAALPPSIGAAVYRIAQESVTNARRHSHGATRVEVDMSIDAGQVRLRITNDGKPGRPGAGGGFGLVGMRERVDALDGTLRSGPREGDGWEVLAQIPLGVRSRLGRVRL